MTYAYDNYVQLPVVDLYDTNVMKMAIEAAKDMYNKGQDQIKDFYKTYGDFMSPFAKDMEAYGQMMGGVRDLINNAYASGIDLLKSPEGRMLISKAVNSVDSGQFNLMRSNAKTGYAYLDAMQKLRSQGKYSEAQELFDIMQNGGGKTFQDFATFDNEGSHVWDRVSPIEAASLLDLTYDSYKNRTPRDLTPEDLKAAGIPYDPRYQYTGYLDSDLMKVAPGAAMALAGDPRAAFFREEAKQMVIARGEQPTEAAIEAQFQRNIANANKWALVDPTKKADVFALEDVKARNNERLEEIRHRHAIDEKDAKESDGNSGGYLQGLAISARAQQLGASGIYTDKKYNNDITTANQIKDPVKKQRARELARTNLMIRLLNSKSHDTGRSIYQMIKELDRGKPGSEGRDVVNNVLSNFAATGNNKLNREVVLESLGFEPGNEAGTYNIPEGSRVLSPHQLLNNIINFGSGDFKEKQSLLKAIQNNANTENDIWGPNWFQSTTNSIANRTSTIKLSTSGKNTIVAPDEHGVDRLYMKVNTIGTSFSHGDHAGFWVETPITYGTSDIGVTSDNTPLIQGSEETEGKLFGNSQRKEAFENRRD